MTHHEWVQKSPLLTHSIIKARNLTMVAPNKRKGPLSSLTDSNRMHTNNTTIVVVPDSFKNTMPSWTLLREKMTAVNHAMSDDALVPPAFNETTTTASLYESETIQLQTKSHAALTSLTTSIQRATAAHQAESQALYAKQAERARVIAHRDAAISCLDQLLTESHAAYDKLSQYTQCAEQCERACEQLQRTVAEEVRLLEYRLSFYATFTRIKWTAPSSSSDTNSNDLAVDDKSDSILCGVVVRTNDWCL
jgi:hypothetical protein